jgi:hypothetical protein
MTMMEGHDDHRDLNRQGARTPRGWTNGTGVPAGGGNYLSADDADKRRFLSVIASSASAGGRPAREEKMQWHRRPCRWKRLRRSAADTGRDAGATESFLPSEAKQSRGHRPLLDCFASLAMTVNLEICANLRHLRIKLLGVLAPWRFALFSNSYDHLSSC